jgi:hypothetical protein
LIGLDVGDQVVIILAALTDPLAGMLSTILNAIPTLLGAFVILASGCIPVIPDWNLQGTHIWGRSKLRREVPMML